MLQLTPHMLSHTAHLTQPRLRGRHRGDSAACRGQAQSFCFLRRTLLLSSFSPFPPTRWPGAVPTSRHPKFQRGSARMAEERPWDPWKQSMWVCGGTTTAGEAANVWAWDGQVIVTQRGTAREPKPTREAVFRRQPDIANDQGDVRPRTVGMPQNVDAQSPSCGFSLRACAPSCVVLWPQ